VAGILNICSALSFGITLFTANISYQWVKYLLGIAFLVNLLAALFILYKSIGKNAYTYLKLYV